ncbi:MAG TPA: hypothetical protein VJM33_06595 [Microthrixaceae bacterium]|nr:hypothetical protein [Microthrixaceae bacterium]
MITPPTLNGQIIGRAERATRALLERLLEPIGLSFPQWATLNMLITGGGQVDGHELTVQVARGLRVSHDDAVGALAGLVDAGLAIRTPEGVATVSRSGEQTFMEVSDGIAEIARHLYGDLLEADLAVAARVLETVTGRADELLQTAPAGIR